MSDNSGRTSDSLPMRWADRAMIPAEPYHDVGDGGVEPKVHLLSMTPDPLGTIASVLALADGVVVRSMGEITNRDRLHYWEQSLATHLRAAWEFVEFHFLFDGVPRWWTQQLERQRTATYFEQSLRFAVVDDLANAVNLPPSLAGTVPRIGDHLPESSREQDWRFEFDDAIEEVDRTYQRLIGMGMPAEDARALLPLGTCTRVHYRTSLRALAEHAGNRLCTQAQFLWRSIFAQIIKEIREYISDPSEWQFAAIADSNIFRPVCYSLGHCPWNADFDRGCKIKERVVTLGKHGIPSSQWDNPPGAYTDGRPLAIQPEEWLLDPTAARFKR